MADEFTSRGMHRSPGLSRRAEGFSYDSAPLKLCPHGAKGVARVRIAHFGHMPEGAWGRSRSLLSAGARPSDAFPAWHALCFKECQTETGLVREGR